MAVILIADDEPRMRKLVKDFLVKEGHQVLEAADGEEAVDRIFGSNSIDLLILDVMMPKRSGLDVLRALRREGCTVPILLLTAKSEIEDRIEGLDAGADDYLPKPFAMDELLARVRAMLRRRVSPEASSKWRIR